MNIGTNWKIEADNMNTTLLKHILVKATDKRPKHYVWRVMGYYPGLKSALKALADFGLSDTDLKDLNTIQKKQEEIYSLIDSLK